MGLVCGLLFGEYCQPLEVLGLSYVGLLQMTVLPYLIFSLIAKMGRLDAKQAKSLGLTALMVLFVLLLVGIVLVVLAAGIFPPMTGASFYSPPDQQVGSGGYNLLEMFIPTNVFHSLSFEYVPAVIVFCLFFGVALIFTPGKEPLLVILDICSEGLGQINRFLVRLAPLGLFTLTAAAAGTLRLDELSRLQGYIVVYTIACVWLAFGMLPLLLCSLTEIRYRDFVRVAQEPLLTAIATGKLFVVLPQIVDKCEFLLHDLDDSHLDADESTASVLVPMAYPFPHVGKVLTFIFVAFAAWYVGRPLSPGETAVMATTGATSSFASPLITVPMLLDQYQLPQDLLSLFVLPGFITTRLADVVGVMHLMVLTLVVSIAMHHRLCINWTRLMLGTVGLLVGLMAAGVSARWYLASTSLEYDLDKRLLALEIPSPYDDLVVYKPNEEIPQRSPQDLPTVEKVEEVHVLRVGYHPDHLPYSYFNSHGHLVGLDVELMHRLADRLQARLEFVPYQYETLVSQLESKEIDLAIGGLMMNPERLQVVGFTESYQTATVAVLLVDHRRGELEKWDDPDMPSDLRLGVVYDDLARAARRQLPQVDIEVIDSLRAYFEERGEDLDGLIISAEEGAAWDVLYPEYAVIVPKPVIQRPVGMAVRLSDGELLRFLNRWLEFERMDGTLERLRHYWIEGGGTQQPEPRWSVLKDELHWLP